MTHRKQELIRGSHTHQPARTLSGVAAGRRVRLTWLCAIAGATVGGSSLSALTSAAAQPAPGHQATPLQATAGAGPSSPAQPQAEPQADEAATDSGAGPNCVISGATAPPKNLEIYDKQAGGVVVAKLVGVETPLKAFEFPTGKDARAKLETGTGKGHFRIEGYVHAKRLPMFTTKSLSVSPGHLWIGAQREVHFDGATPGRLRVTKHMTTPLSQTFRTWTSCKNLTFDEGTPPAWSVDGDARGYRMKSDSIVLYNDYSRDKSEVVTLNRASGAEMLFWSTKRHGSYVQVAYQGEIMLEAWAKASALKALPRGEVMDQAVAPKRHVTGAKLTLQGDAKLIKTTREHYIRAEAKEDAPKIGRIEIGTETYVLNVVAGWASVVPKNATVMPPENGQFWVNAEDLGLNPTPAKPGPAPSPAE